jgi:hypothetical protein
LSTIFNNINKPNNYPSPQIVVQKRDHDIYNMTMNFKVFLERVKWLMESQLTLLTTIVYAATILVKI